MDYLKVSSKSSPASVAGAIAGLIKDGMPVEIQSVGAGAVNQAIKAIAIARGFLIPSGIDVLCAPTFQDIEIDGECRTAIRISVYPHALAVPSPTLSEGHAPDSVDHASHLSVVQADHAPAASCHVLADVACVAAAIHA